MTNGPWPYIVWQINAQFSTGSPRPACSIWGCTYPCHHVPVPTVKPLPDESGPTYG